MKINLTRGTATRMPLFKTKILFPPSQSALPSWCHWDFIQNSHFSLWIGSFQTRLKFCLNHCIGPGFASPKTQTLPWQGWLWRVNWRLNTKWQWTINKTAWNLSWALGPAQVLEKEKKIKGKQQTWTSFPLLWLLNKWSHRQGQGKKNVDLKVNSSAERSLWRGSSGLFTQKQGGSTWTVALKAPAGQRQRMKCGIREYERKSDYYPI